jgi:hypothetical protein
MADAEIRHHVAAFLGAILCPVQSERLRYAAHESWEFIVNDQPETTMPTRIGLEGVFDISDSQF